MVGCVASLALAVAGGVMAAQPETRVLCTTFPVYQIARQVTRGREGLRLERMLPANLGCPHDYMLTPQDIRKIADADVLIVNGLGLEEFLGAPVRRANPAIRIVDSSAGATNVIRSAHSHAHAHEHRRRWWQRRHRHEPSANPHLFASPRQTAILAATIAAGLAEADPDGAALYARNARAYAETMNALADDMAELGRTLANNRIVVQHGAFDYLARDMGLEIVAAIQAHGGRDPAAAEILRLAQAAREKGAGAVFSEPQYPDRLAQTLAREAGLPHAVLDPVATGPANVGPEYYETVMRRNMATLKATLGVRAETETAP